MAPKPPGASRALLWSFANTAISKLATLAIGVVLARLLGPEAFGTFAVAMVALLAVLSFNELGVSLAIVRWRSDPREIAPTVTTISVIGSALFFAAGFVAAPGFSVAMGAPDATPVVQLMLVSVLVNGVVATPAALLQREFRQGTRTIIDQVNTWLGAIISIVLALLGWGAMSLAIGRVVATVVSGAMFLIVSPLPYRFGWHRELAGRLLRFGLPLAGASIIVFAIGYADQFVAGALLGATVLGYYVLAFNLASWPVTMFSQPLRAVAPAAFARMQDRPDELSASFGAVFRALCALALPVCFLLAGAAEPIVELVYGESWLPAAAILRWLAIFAAVRIVFELSYDYLVVVGRTRWILVVQVVWLAVLVPSVWLGASWAGAAGIAIAQLVIGVVVVLPLYLWGLHRGGVALGAALRRSSVPLAVGLAVLAATYAVSASIADVVVACVVSGVIGLTGFVLAAALDRSAFREALHSWRRREDPTAEPSATEALT
ncbi:lipopolysaccharide biosynthesis protein [Agromyces sp. Leaf222]|uniref:lipopolysaccharide biosynthesis protein n=1 Tax=Agromyces sp. Leaf222 TaxID=1735688 RepID=UPI000A63348A|nr:lipopolysaccharide biosynthesis protein [Agromyces sp. Leaf222]